MFKPEITTSQQHGFAVQSIHITGRGTYTVTTRTLALVTEYLAAIPVARLRSRMARNCCASEGERAELGGVRRAELIFMAAEYPSLYVPGMVRALGLTFEPEGCFWVTEAEKADHATATVTRGAGLVGHYVLNPSEAVVFVLATADGSIKIRRMDGITRWASPWHFAPATEEQELEAAIDWSTRTGELITWDDFMAQVRAGERDFSEVTLFGGLAVAPGVKPGSVQAVMATPGISRADMPNWWADRERTDPRCATCHRDAHRASSTGWQGHAYVRPSS